MTIIDGAIHPDSRSATRIRIIIEYKHIGPDPYVNIELVNGPSRNGTTSKVFEGEPEWRYLALTAIREEGQPFGDCLDEFIYTTRDIEARRFQIADLGPVGDLNLDGNVNQTDIQVVMANTGSTGLLEIEEGDANLDGSVDTNDVNVVLDNTPESTELSTSDVQSEPRMPTGMRGFVFRIQYHGVFIPQRPEAP